MTMESDQIILFLRELDSHLNFRTPVTLYLAGGAAITLVYDHENRTADLDFVDLPGTLMRKGGQNSSLAKKYRVYLSHLPEISFSVPSDWRTKCTKLPETFSNFEIQVASLEDIVLGKLARLEPKDFEDIISLYESKFLNPEKLLSRLRNNKKELMKLEYRNNAKLLFKEVFHLRLTFEKGCIKVTDIRGPSIIRPFCPP